MPPDEPTRYGLYQRLLRARQVLEEVAGALERRCADLPEGDQRAALSALAQWIRRRLHELWLRDRPRG